MPTPEGLPIIIDTRKEDETCTQYVFGPEEKFIDIALKKLIASGEYTELENNTPLQEGDIVFYTDAHLRPQHVGKIDNQGHVTSKFTGDVNVYKHELRGDPVPPFSSSSRVAMYIGYRKIMPPGKTR